MNTIEREMLSHLKELKGSYGVVSVKAEFEAEGTRVDELLRLLELANKADLKVALKIGGCEAVRDLIESKNYGVDYIIAPMVETEYSLKKYIEAVEKVYPDRDGTEFLYNVETATGYQNRKSIAAAARGMLDGAVFGRVDYVGSLGLPRDAINEDVIISDVIDVAHECKNNNLDMLMGGGVSIDSLEALRTVRDVKLDRFETRKIVFSSDSVDIKGIEKGMLKAVQFELAWLKNKRSYYEFIYKEDDARIYMLEGRWKKMFDMYG